MIIEDAVAKKPAPKAKGRWIVAALGGIAAAVLLGVVLMIHFWPFTKTAVIDALESRSARSVEIGSFRQTWFPPGCVAENVTLLRHKHPDQTPVLSIRRLEVKGRYSDLLTFRKRIDTVVLTGMRVMIPPKQPDGKPRPIPLTEGKSGTTMQIGRIVGDDSILDFMPAQKGREPYRVKLQHLTITDVGAGAPMRFATTLMTPRPAAVIQASGNFGPWKPGDPSSTSVSGSFHLLRMDLGSSKLVSGLLTAQGTFHGPLKQIEAAGSTEIPRFHVSGSGNDVNLSTTFTATVNGTSGDTVLRQVKARVDHTSATIEGSVAGQPGKSIALRIAVSDGRISDLLRIFVAAKQSPMEGAVSLQGSIMVPPGREQFVRKIVMSGDFGIGAEHFTKAATQTPIDRLSESAQGAPSKEIRDDPQIVLGNLKGHVSVRNGIATLSGLSFTVPGATARMQGTFNLVNHQVDLHGVLSTSGKLSDTTTGFKALVVKAITPFFRKKQSVRIVPFKITGTYGHTHVGL